MNVKVFPDSKRVVAYYTNPKWEVRKAVLKAIRKQGRITQDLEYYLRDMLHAIDVPHVYPGVAICSPMDEWDEDYGIQLAKARARANLAGAVQGATKFLFNKTCFMMNNAYHVMLKATRDNTFLKEDVYGLVEISYFDDEDDE